MEKELRYGTTHTHPLDLMSAKGAVMCVGPAPFPQFV